MANQKSVLTRPLKWFDVMTLTWPKAFLLGLFYRATKQSVGQMDGVSGMPPAGVQVFVLYFLLRLKISLWGKS